MTMDDCSHQISMIWSLRIIWCKQCAL